MVGLRERSNASQAKVKGATSRVRAPPLRAGAYGIWSNRRELKSGDEDEGGRAIISPAHAPAVDGDCEGRGDDAAGGERQREGDEVE